jgi:hypothetical protein
MRKELNICSANKGYMSTEKIVNEMWIEMTGSKTCTSWQNRRLYRNKETPWKRWLWSGNRLGLIREELMQKMLCYSIILQQLHSALTIKGDVRIIADVFISYFLFLRFKSFFSKLCSETVSKYWSPRRKTK